MPSQVLPITRQTLHQAARVLAEAFINEPVSVAVYGSRPADRRVGALKFDFAAALQVAMRRGCPIQISRDGHLAAAASIYPPGAYPIPTIEQWLLIAKSVLSNGWYDVAGWIKWLNQADKHHPALPHYYLEYIGVDPPYQGTGLGSCIMRNLVSKADEAEVGCYLENADPGNESFYQRFGFEPLAEEDVIGIHTWYLWREPVQNTVRHHPEQGQTRTSSQDYG